MNIRPIALTLLSLGTLASASLLDEEQHRTYSIEDLKTQLAGTSWRAMPIRHLRPGLAPLLTFADGKVAPAGYAYDINARDSLTIHFNHGDTQLLLLAHDGRHLKLVFRGQQFDYELTAHQ